MRRTLLLPLIPVTFLTSIAAFGCGGNIERVDDRTQDGSGAGSGASAGGGRGGSGSGSGGSGASGAGNVSSGDAQCDGIPECTPGDQQAASEAEACIELPGLSCYTLSSCGVTIWCQHFVAPCTGDPTCPDGYAEVKGCIPDSDCQVVTTCGKSVICQGITP